jgi:hypothetical protein
MKGGAFALVDKEEALVLAKAKRDSSSIKLDVLGRAQGAKQQRTKAAANSNNGAWISLVSSR